MLSVSVTPSKLVLDDKDLICRQASCGVRGGYNGIEVQRRMRRPIRYLKLIRESSDFNEALREHGGP